MLSAMEECYVQGHKPRSHAGLSYVDSKIGYLDYGFSWLYSVSNKIPWQILLSKKKKKKKLSFLLHSKGTFRNAKRYGLAELFNIY